MKYAVCVLIFVRVRQAIALLVAQNKATPHVSKVYWRTAWLLFSDEKPEHALVTLYRGAQHGVTKTKMGSKLATLARRCMLELYGPVAFGNAVSTYIGAGVLQVYSVCDEATFLCVFFLS